MEFFLHTSKVELRRRYHLQKMARLIATRKNWWLGSSPGPARANINPNRFKSDLSQSERDQAHLRPRRRFLGPDLDPDPDPDPNPEESWPKQPAGLAENAGGSDPELDDAVESDNL
ncbi:hypothetical protein LIER_27540 [Lithospermum erythrorhizon]|uniref:Uncharacterized protein n=1 Tax=Lithospermum erythrorhizon TaxID=34254 RepID=A0AAV3RDY6_LITER